MEATQIITAIIAAIVGIAGTAATFMTGTARLRHEIQADYLRWAAGQFDELREELEEERKARRVLKDEFDAARLAWQAELKEERQARQRLTQRVQALEREKNDLLRENQALRLQVSARGRKEL